MKRPKYHYLTIIRDNVGKTIVALPGQSFGTLKVPTGIRVKDKGKANIVNKARQNGNPGDIFFTTTLTRGQHELIASDIYPLEGNDNILFADAQEHYEKLKNGK